MIFGTDYKRSAVGGVPHTIFGALATGAFLVAGVSAYKLMKKQDLDFFKKSFHIAIMIGLITSILVAVFGHQQAQYLVDTRPMKMARGEPVGNER